MTTVLIAVDGSKLDLVVAERARHLFGDDAHYVVVNVREDPITFATVPVAEGYSATVPPAAWVDLADDPDAASRDARGVADDIVDRTGIPDAEPLGEVGAPAHVILRAAEAHSVDVIVLGSHDRNWIDRWLDPSVSRAITHSSTVPVLLVRDPGTES
jgi:nucleotide-binding universal stress UspA family protein